MPRRSTKNDAASVDQVVDRLYSLDAEEFTVARKEAAKQLKDEGDKTGSDLVNAWSVPELAVFGR